MSNKYFNNDYVNAQLAHFQGALDCTTNQDAARRAHGIGLLSAHPAGSQNSAKSAPLKSTPPQVSMTNCSEFSLRKYFKYPFQKPGVSTEVEFATFALLSKALGVRAEPKSAIDMGSWSTKL